VPNEVDKSPVPSLPNPPKTFSTTSTQFAAQLITDEVLRLLSWDLAASREVEFTFDDPEAKGPDLEIAFRNSRDFRLFQNRQYLIEKMRSAKGFVRGGNNAKG
jgi:hypothetical protein